LEIILEESSLLLINFSLKQEQKKTNILEYVSSRSLLRQLNKSRKDKSCKKEQTNLEKSYKLGSRQDPQR